MAETSNHTAVPTYQTAREGEDPERKRKNENGCEDWYPGRKYSRRILCEETPKWDTYWMAFVFLTAQRSKSFNTKVHTGLYL